MLVKLKSEYQLNSSLAPLVVCFLRWILPGILNDGISLDVMDITKPILILSYAFGNEVKGSKRKARGTAIKYILSNH